MFDQGSMPPALRLPSADELAGRLAAEKDQWALRASGLRVTAARLAVLAAVREGDHWTADQIAARARERLGSISTQAVYDSLAALGEAGLVRRIEPAGSPARHEARVGDNHHHVICRSCGTIGDVDCAVGEPPCLEPSLAGGFLVDEAEITFWGLCLTCSGARPPGAPDPAPGTAPDPPQPAQRSTPPATSARSSRDGGDASAPPKIALRAHSET